MSRFRRVTIALVVLWTLTPTLAFGQAPRAGVVTTLEGNVTVNRVATPQPQPLKFRDDVFVNDKVTTGDRALARMLLGGKAVVTVRERSGSLGFGAGAASAEYGQVSSSTSSSSLIERASACARKSSGVISIVMSWPPLLDATHYCRYRCITQLTVTTITLRGEDA